jgi:hypothetical protein
MFSHARLQPSFRGLNRIEQAKADWKSGRFDAVRGDAEEFIPLPDADKVVS